MAKAAGPSEGFRGFGRGALAFFTELSENQNRDWFLANRGRYDQEILAPMSALIGALALAFEAHDIPLTGNVKQSMFRIHRDVRFSKDKSPYKTNASCVFSRDGSKQGTGILYLQIGGTDKSFMALGFYGPEPDDLAALRQAIVERPRVWADTAAALEKAGLTLSADEALVRMPKGFEAHAEAPFADTLRLKSFVVRRKIKPAHVHSTALVDDTVAFARDGLPLLAFGRNAIDRGRGRTAQDI